VGEEEQMNPTPNAQLPTPNAERSEHSTLGVGRSALDVGRFLWRILDFVVAGIFIFAGLTKILDLDHLIADLQHLRVANAFADLGQLSLASPAEFASDIDNFKILPWPVSVALAFYLPWLEIFCALGLVFRFLYRGALSILSASIVVFTLATIAAKVRGLDITCGCFGHASQNWSFPAHLITNLAILAALLVLLFKATSRNRLQNAV
jgi:putative oxidoreductase